MHAFSTATVKWTTTSDKWLWAQHVICSISLVCIDIARRSIILGWTSYSELIQNSVFHFMPYTSKITFTVEPGIGWTWQLRRFRHRLRTVLRWRPYRYPPSILTLYPCEDVKSICRLSCSSRPAIILTWEMFLFKLFEMWVVSITSQIGWMPFLNKW